MSIKLDTCDSCHVKAVSLSSALGTPSVLQDTADHRISWGSACLRGSNRARKRCRSGHTPVDRWAAAERWEKHVSALAHQLPDTTGDKRPIQIRHGHCPSFTVGFALGRAWVCLRGTAVGWRAEEGRRRGCSQEHSSVKVRIPSVILEIFFSYCQSTSASPIIYSVCIIPYPALGNILYWRGKS